MNRKYVIAFVLLIIVTLVLAVPGCGGRRRHNHRQQPEHPTPTVQPQPSTPTATPSQPSNPHPSSPPVDNRANPTPAPPQESLRSTTLTVNTAAIPHGVNSKKWMQMFFDDPQNPMLTLAIPGYVYFQGVVYAKGNIKSTGPIRVIGGIVSNKEGRNVEDGGKISLENGAILTTNPEYLEKYTDPPKIKYKVVKWREVDKTVK